MPEFLRSYSRRKFIFTSATAVTVAATGALSLRAWEDTSKSVSASERQSIRPFRVNIPEQDLTDLRRRIKATRWPDRETVPDQSQGVQLATMKELAHYWGTAYNWRNIEENLNSLPQYITEIDGLDIHFIHVRSRHANALPIILTHGWPGSILEFLKVIDPLSNPTAHGGRAEDAFHLVIPSMPGYGFSERPTTTGWGPDRIARAWAVLMERLGYKHYVSQGGDWGAVISDKMAVQKPAGLLGIHVNFPATVPPDIAKKLACGDPVPTDLSLDEKAAYNKLATFYKTGSGYSAMMVTRPQTEGYGLTDSPVGLAAWMYDKFAAWTYSSGHPERVLTKDEMLNDITLYWVTNTAVSSSRLYWENNANNFNAVSVSIPAAITVFPGEIYQAPRSWASRAYHDLFYYHKVRNGGHFAAWEVPDIFTNELRAAFTSLRNSRRSAGK
ncbi:epoxide hydrolase 1 [Streptomyces sp. NBC_01799]|uniref:epoxide hydrolase family protein n=1 Tax=Streptomyces sp. NBC_01800 TaxID=2975945 RepID=UPI002DDA91BA|nr:epoxide hydrolase [Streptomyces sp. NBC_01800]WSA72114.1 epoxide hydrolase 1 [Streptomyces sp. NBC_01800]WSA80635.1 epoxide hydrolase 1 [Streptomyces sp. NBC_01799]